MVGPIFWKIDDPLISFHFLNAYAINNRFWQKKLAHSVRPKTVLSHLNNLFDWQVYSTLQFPHPGFFLLLMQSPSQDKISLY